MRRSKRCYPSLVLRTRPGFRRRCAKRVTDLRKRFDLSSIISTCVAPSRLTVAQSPVKSGRAQSEEDRRARVAGPIWPPFLTKNWIEIQELAEAEESCPMIRFSR